MAVVGDNLDSGIAGAKRAGLDAIRADRAAGQYVHHGQSGHR
jgi:FMN phosphatase YigB (HAD superfamily)